MDESHAHGRGLPAVSSQKNRFAALRQMHPLCLRHLTLQESDSLRFARRWRSYKSCSLPPHRGRQVMSLRRCHHHLSARWAALFWEESLLQCHFHVLGVDSLESQRRQSRGTSTLNSQLCLFHPHRRLRRLRRDFGSSSDRILTACCIKSGIL